MALKIPGTNHTVSCFGYLDGILFLGTRHHMAIMNFLLSHGWDWDDLLKARQAWGWLRNGDLEPDVLPFRLSTDAAAIDATLAPNIAAALEHVFGIPAELQSVWQPSNQVYAPNLKGMYGVGEGQDKPEWNAVYENDPIPGTYVYDSHTGEGQWVNDSDPEQFPPPKTVPTTPPVPTVVPGGGMPPPKKAMWHEATTKFVYDTETGKLVSSDEWNAHHFDLFDQLDPDPVYMERVWNRDPHIWANPRYLFGEHLDGEEPNIDDGHGLVPTHKIQQALQAYQQQKTALFSDARRAWLIDYKGNLRIGDTHQHHADLGWGGDELAEGDIYLGVDPYTGTPNGQNTIRLLRYNLDYDSVELLHRAWEAWDQQHPDLEITKSEFIAPTGDGWEDDPWEEGLTNHASYDIIGGMKTSMFNNDTVEGPDGPWTLYQMESGEYPNHHALVVDRNRKRLFLNYHGHHGPLMDEAVENGIPLGDFYDTVMGHYRLEPSDSEPFGEGWGFHNGHLQPWEEALLTEHLKKYHQVNDLEDAWVGNKEARYEWVPACEKAGAVSVNWKGAWDRAENVLYLWNTCGDESHHADKLASILGQDKIFKNGNIKKSGGFVLTEGTYTNPSFIIAPGAKNPVKDTEKVRALLDKALLERYPTVEKESNFRKKSAPMRFMVERSGNVVMGHYPSHYALICDYAPEAAEHYGSASPPPEFPFIGGGFLDNGTIKIVHSEGEQDFDPAKIAAAVFSAAQNQGNEVTGEVIYEDWRANPRTKEKFHLSEREGVVNGDTCFG